MTKLLNLWLQFSSPLSSLKDQFFNQSFKVFFFCIGKKKKKMFKEENSRSLFSLSPTLPFWQDNARVWEFGSIQPLTRQKALTAVIFQREVTAWCAPLNTQATKRKQLKTHSVHFTHTIVTRASFRRSNLSTEVTFLERRSIFSCFKLCCHQQFYGRMSSFVDLKSNHHFIFFGESLGSLHSLLMWI